MSEVCVIVDCPNPPAKDSKACVEHVDTADWKRIIRQRDFIMVNQVAKKTSTAENLLTVLEDRTVDVLEDLLEELATLVHLADANRSVPTDKGRRGHGDALPSFDSAAADRQLRDAAGRLRSEYEKLSGAVRNPSSHVEPQCVECGRRVRIVDAYCGPCGAAILKQYRRATDGVAPRPPRQPDTKLIGYLEQPYGDVNDG